MKEEDRTFLLKFGNNVRLRRLELGLSQEKLASLCDFHSTYIGMIERAERKISILAAFKLATALNITIDALINFSSNEQD
jgi:transcriptional regulator with XRE-family HTH domain